MSRSRATSETARTAPALGVLPAVVLSLVGLTACSSGPADRLPAETGTPAASTAAVSPSAVSPSAVSPSAVTRCQDGETVATLLADTPTRSHTPWKGVAGATVMFTNVSNRTCWLHGYPGVEFYRDGKQFSQGSSRLDGVDPVLRVTLAPGQSGYAEIMWTAQSADDKAVEEIGIIAPDQKRQFTVRAPGLVMADDYRSISVMPVTATVNPKPGPGPS